MRTKKTVRVNRIPGEGCKIKLAFEFDPEEIGEVRSKRIWDSLGTLIADVLITDSDRAAFLVEMKRAAKKAGMNLKA